MQYVVYGLLMGCVLLLATVGFSMIRRVEGFLKHCARTNTGSWGLFLLCLQQPVGLGHHPLGDSSCAGIRRHWLSGCLRSIFSSYRKTSPDYCHRIHRCFVCHSGLDRGVLWTKRKAIQVSSNACH